MERPWCRARARRADQGQAVVVLVAVVALAALLVVAVAALGSRLARHERAQAAADAVALAGVVDGRHRAGEVARRNGAQIVDYHEDGDAVTVLIELDGERVTARATDAP